jgi:3D (Asp-Asp-Asp) domain-containing protein
MVLLKKEEEVVANEKRAKLHWKKNKARNSLSWKAKRQGYLGKAAEQAKVDAKAKAIVAAEKDVVKVDNQLIIKTDPIYFDYNLWYIRRDTRPVLDKVIDPWRSIQQWLSEISSHR